MATTHDVQCARINATADGDNTVIAGVANRQIRIIGYAIVASAAGTVTLQDSANTVFAHFPLAANGGISYAGSSDSPVVELPQGLGFEVSNGAGVDTSGHVTYVLV